MALGSKLRTMVLVDPNDSEPDEAIDRLLLFDKNGNVILSETLSSNYGTVIDSEGNLIWGLVLRAVIDDQGDIEELVIGEVS